MTSLIPDFSSPWEGLTLNVCNNSWLIDWLTPNACKTNTFQSYVPLDCDVTEMSVQSVSAGPVIFVSN